jgi:predicted nucleic acid-binding Zn ribbon protein
MPHDWKSDWHPEDDEEDFCRNNEVEDCPHCGETIYDDSEQCSRCGTYLNASEDAADSKPRRHPWLVVVGVLFCLVVFAIWIFGRK